jgi:hypothetical protein
LALPFCHSSLQIGFAASVAQAGSAIFSAPLRGVLMRSVDRPFQQEAMGWMRTANNLGGIFSYSIAGLSGHFGLLPLFLIDASTSLAAAAITHFFLGNTPSNTSVKNDQHTIHSRTNPALLDWTLYLSAATLIAGFGFLMQMFITGAATKFRLEHAESGVAIFSRIMLINTVMCTALNVFASRLFKRPAIAMPLGIALMGLGGTLVFLNGSGTPEKYLFGAFLLTLGELSFAAVSQLLVMRLVPKVKNQASVFSVGVFIQTGGSMLGASSALLFIQSHNAGWCFAAAAMAILIAQLGITRLIERLKPDCI